MSVYWKIFGQNWIKKFELFCPKNHGSVKGYYNQKKEIRTIETAFDSWAPVFGFRWWHNRRWAALRLREKRILWLLGSRVAPRSNHFEKCNNASANELNSLIMS
jgi:hypothetical protein